MAPMITLLGLGPGDPPLLTQARLADTWKASLRSTCALASTLPWLASQPSLQIHSFDDLYDQYPSYDDVYAHIIEQILELGNAPTG